MKHDRVDKLVQLAYLEGEVRTHKAYENAVGARKVSARTSEPTKAELVQRLERALEAGVQKQVPLTVGAFLRDVRDRQSLRTQEIFPRLGLTLNIYRMLEQDRISPLKVSAASWKRLCTLLNLSIDDLVEMIRRTHQLVFFRPAFRTTLARYDKRRKRSAKAVTLEKAAVELYTRARLELPQAEQSKLDGLIKAITQ